MKFSIYYNDDFYSKRTMFPFIEKSLDVKQTHTNFNGFDNDIYYYETSSINNKFEKEFEKWLYDWILTSEEFAEENDGECDNAVCVAIYEDDFHKKENKDFLCDSGDVDKIFEDIIKYLKNKLK